jgi:APA family basic amino acid/polyamine antiporter
MGRDGLMFSALGKISEATRVPIAALIVQGLWACLLALSGSFDTLTDYVIFGSWIFYALATASVFVFRKKYPDMERPYKAFGYPVVPVLFLLAATGLLVNYMWFTPRQSFIGIFLILLGLPVYYYLTRRKNGEPTEE